MGGRFGRVLRLLIDLGAIGAALGFISTYFPASVMFTTTTTNGGDMGSHYYPAAFMRDVLLPRGQVIGWCPGNYCGYPLFQFYFPLPFLLIAAMSLAVPFPVAFKLGTVAGTFLLPVATYLSLRFMGVPFPGPALGALTPLFFLFMEANSMWGGNVPSTLAGEFSLSLGLALTILFFGTLQYTVRTGKGRGWNGLLVAAIGLSHGYTLLWAGLTSLVELVAARRWWHRVGVLVAVHGLGILLMGFFLLELIGYGPWTTAYNHSWPIRDWREVMPPILWAPAITSALTTLVIGVLCLFRRQPFPRPLGTLWASMGIALLFWLTAHSFHVVDIRFWPFIQLGFCITAAVGLGYVLSLLPGAEIWPIVGALAILPTVQSRITFIPSWITWNYSGFEKKGPWPTFRGVNDHLRGDFRSPRVVYEHSPDHESIGTVRAFEDLPLFSGRSTLEGLYMQSSPTSPFVFYTQSEISKDISCPFPDYGCSRLDLDRGLGHLRMFNVSHYIVRSTVVKAAAAQHPGLTRETVIGPFEIYRVKDNADRYAIPLMVAPVAVVTDHWKELAYRWFKRAGPDDPTPVFVTALDERERGQFGGVVDGLPKEWPRVPLAAPPALEETLETDRITVTGCRPGHPVLIRISYHPRWLATTGEKVWLAGPSFMLVVPKGDRIELAFDGGFWVTAAHTFTTLGVILLVGSLLPGVRRRAARAVTRLGELAPAPIMAPVRWIWSAGDWNVGRRRMLLGGGLAVSAVLFTAFAVGAYRPNVEGVYREGQRLYDAGKLDQALPNFQEAQRIAPLSATAIHATYYEAIINFRQDRWQIAEDVFRRLLATFPEAPNAPEALYHIGLCRARLGDIPGARDAWQQTQTRYPTTPWGKYAGDRLKEVESRGA